jgi:replication-associated recombination protein RarA
MEYEEVFACKLDETYVDDLKFELRREENILFIDEIQDASKDLQKKIRSNLGSPRALIIFATTHRHEIEDALFNRLKSFEYQLRRPTVAEGATYLKEEFEKLKISYQSEQQLARIVVGLDREMRPCAEFPRKVVAEANGILTDDYLDQLFGPQEIIPNESIHSTDEWAV